MTEAEDRPLAVAFVLGSAVGGTAAHARALAAGCRGMGLDVSAFGPLSTAGLFDAGIAFTPVQIAAGPRLVGDVRAIARLRHCLRLRRPDVVHAHGVRAGAFAALALTTTGRDRPALAVTVHNAPPQGRTARLVYGLLERVCIRGADILLSASPDLLTRLRTRGAKHAERFDVPADAAPPPAAAQVARLRRELSGGRPIVLAVARLARQKGLDVMIDAAVRWQQRTPRPVTVIAGDGPLRNALAARAERAGVDVRLLGRRDDVPALLAAADVVVVPSRWEARALVVQETMRAGRPLIATRVGGTAELTGEDAAWLIPPDDAAALAVAVAAVLDDPTLAARRGLAARARSASFPAQDDAVRRAVAIYAQLAASRASGRCTMSRPEADSA